MDPVGRHAPAVVFGTSCLGNLFRVAPDAEKRAAVRQWVEAAAGGPVFIDTAGKYGAGLALEALGRELDATGTDPARVVVCNKLGWRRVPLRGPEPTFERGAWVGLRHDAIQDIGYDGMLRCWDEGCRLLGRYTPAVACLHDPDEFLAGADSAAEHRERRAQVRDAFRALADLKRDGRVRAVGVGAKDWAVVRDLTADHPLDWVMIANSLTVMRHPPGVVSLVESLAAAGTCVINAAVLHSGFLVGGEFLDYRPAEAGTAEGSGALAWRERFRAVCGRFAMDPVDACVRFAGSPPGVAGVAIDGSARFVRRNVAATTAVIPDPLWWAMKDEGLIDRDFPYLG